MEHRTETLARDYNTYLVSLILHDYHSTMHPKQMKEMGEKPPKIMQKKAYHKNTHITYWRCEEEEEEKFHSEVTFNNFAQDANSTETVKVKHCMTTSIFDEELHTHKIFLVRARTHETTQTNTRT